MFFPGIYYQNQVKVSAAAFPFKTSLTLTTCPPTPPPAAERGRICAFGWGTCRKLREDGRCIHCPLECSCPLSNEFYWKRHLMDCPQCEINLFPGFRSNCPQGLEDEQ